MPSEAVEDREQLVIVLAQQVADGPHPPRPPPRPAAAPQRDGDGDLGVDEVRKQVAARTRPSGRTFWATPPGGGVPQLGQPAVPPTPDDNVLLALRTARCCVRLELANPRPALARPSSLLAAAQHGLDVTVRRRAATALVVPPSASDTCDATGHGSYRPAAAGITVQLPPHLADLLVREPAMSTRLGGARARRTTIWAPPQRR